MTGVQTSDKRALMNIIKAAKPTVRLFAAMLVTVTVIGLSTLATHAPAQIQNPVTLKSIQTDRAATFYADSAQIARGLWNWFSQPTASWRLTAQAQIAPGLWSWFSQPARAS